MRLRVSVVIRGLSESAGTFGPVILHRGWMLFLAMGGLLVGCVSRPSPDTSGPAPTAEPEWAALALARLPMLEVCERPGIEEDLLCGTLEVYEDRAAQSGKRIGLNVVVIPAQSSNPPDDPVFIFEGGPGGAATRRAGASVYAGPVRERDIVLVDQRGTGNSNPLQCEWDAEFHEGELREIFPTDLVVSCAAEIAKTTDVRFYTTDHFVDDIEEIRQRLGYGPINVRGGSYGTWSMMTFAQRHQESTRSLFGIGLHSPSRSNLAERGIWTDRTLEGLASFCVADPDCQAIAPDLETMTREALQGLDSGPQRVELADPSEPEKILAIDVGRDWLSEQLRLVLYYTYTSRALPWAMHRIVAAEDWTPMMTLAVLIERSFRTGLAHGLVLTVQCSEHMDFDVEEALARGEETVVGNYRLEQQMQGCAAWPHEKLPKFGVDEVKPLPIPALFISGALDPVTPAEYGEEALSLFPNGKHLVLAEGQHGPFDLENSWVCVHQIWADFLAAGSVDGLDVECAAAMHRPPFIVDEADFENYVTEVLLPWSS